MTGQEILEALSFVDERYVAEAETARLGRNTPWMKWVSMAACLCILITGVYAYKLLQPKGATESMAEPEAAAPQAMAEATAEEASAHDRDMVEEAAPEAAPEAAAEGSTIVSTAIVEYAKVRVIKTIEGADYEVGYEAVVLADEPMEVDTAVILVIDPSKIPGADAENYGGMVDLAEGDLVEISNGIYDSETNILYVASVLIVEE